MLEKYLRKLYGGDFDVSTDIEPSAWREVLRILNDAVATGISQSDAAPTLEQDFYDRLRHANEVFSAFKVHSMGKRMATLLTDDSGQLKPFRQWRDEVMPIASHYVGPWLRTEYNTAVNRAHDAADWKQFERNRDIMPNLRWMPTTSAEPDAIHRIFWKMKLTRPIDDPFWNKHRPGDHWNCKCTLEQTDDPATDIPAGADDEAPQPGLKGNPAKTGQIFDRSHPYFPKSCKGCTFAKGFKNKLKGLFNAEGDCYKCKKDIAERIFESQRKSILNKLKKDQNYKNVAYNKLSKGIKATHIGHIEHSNPKEQRFFNGLTSSDLERNCQNILYDKGKTVILLDESKKKNGNFLPALDMEMDDRIMDIRSITGKGWYSSAIITKNNQIKKYNNRDDIEKKADSMCFYFHDPNLYNERKMKKSINFYRHYRDNNGDLIEKHIKHIICVINDKDKTIVEFDI